MMCGQWSVDKKNNIAGMISFSWKPTVASTQEIDSPHFDSPSRLATSSAARSPAETAPSMYPVHLKVNC